jgi:hypothetical protein
MKEFIARKGENRGPSHIGSLQGDYFCFNKVITYFTKAIDLVTDHWHLKAKQIGITQVDQMQKESGLTYIQRT